MSQIKTIVETINIPQDKIKPSPYQPRLSFNLEDLRGTIKRDGILVPLVVREKEGYYELIDGERRLRLSRELGYKTVPCTVIDVDDETADRMVWKVNTLRQDYQPEEKARHWRHHQDEGMSLRGIARDHDEHPQWVLAHLNVFKLPEKYQRLVWETGVAPSVGHIQELESLFSSGVQIGTITNRLDLIIDRRLTVHEFRGVLKPDLEEIRETRIEAAMEAAKEFAPVPEEVKIETPEELEKAAKALRDEAERRKTPEQRAAEESEKERIKGEAAEKKRRDAEEKARSSLLTGKNNVQSRIDKAIEEGLDTTEFNSRLKEVEAMITEEPIKAFKEAKKLKDDIDTTIREEKIRREAVEAERKKLEAEAESKLEEERERLQKDPEFRRSVVIERAEKEEIMKELVKDRDIIREGQRIGRELAEAQIDLEELEERRKEQRGRPLFWLKLGIKSIIRKQERGELFCPEHKESKLIWDCGCKLEDTLKQIEGKED